MTSREHNIFRNRVRLIGFFFLGLFLVVASRLIYLQGFCNNFLSQQAAGSMRDRVGSSDRATRDGGSPNVSFCLCWSKGDPCDHGDERQNEPREAESRI